MAGEFISGNKGTASRILMKKYVCINYISTFNI